MEGVDPRRWHPRASSRFPGWPHRRPSYRRRWSIGRGSSKNMVASLSGIYPHAGYQRFFASGLAPGNPRQKGDQMTFEEICKLDSMVLALYQEATAFRVLSETGQRIRIWDAERAAKLRPD